MSSKDSASASNSKIRRRLSASIPFEQILELRVLLQECKLHGADRSVTLLGNDEISFTRVLFILLIDFLAIDEQDDVSVLLDRSRLTEVG